MTAAATDVAPFDSPADWTGADLVSRSEEWLYELGPAEAAELVSVVRGTEIAPGEVVTDPPPLPALEAGITEWLRRMRSGLGFVLVRGLSVDDLTDEEAARAYWLLGLHLGEPVSQNVAGELLVPITDTGADPDDHDTRLYTTSAELSFHTDGADLISLLCLRTSRAGGTSRLCSSVHLYNEIVRRRPDLVPLVTEPFAHHAHGQAGPAGPQHFPMPIVTIDGPVFRMFLLLWYIRNAAEDFPECRLTRPQEELLDLLEQIPNEPGTALDMDFRPGDMQFLKNSVILHARTPYHDWEEPERKRLLLRMWLSRPDFHDGTAILRGGVPARPPSTD